MSSFDTLSPKWLWRTYWIVFLCLNLAMMYRSYYLKQLPSEYFDLTLLSIVMIVGGFVNYLKSRTVGRGLTLWMTVLLFFATAIVVSVIWG